MLAKQTFAALYCRTRSIEVCAGRFALHSAETRSGGKIRLMVEAIRSGGEVHNQKYPIALVAIADEPPTGVGLDYLHPCPVLDPLYVRDISLPSQFAVD